MNQDSSTSKHQQCVAAQADSCKLDGASAREHGVARTENPYLRPEALPLGTGERYRWYESCDSWWRGWDDEPATAPGTLKAAAGDALDAGPDKAAFLRSLGRAEPRLQGLVARTALELSR